MRSARVVVGAGVLALGLCIARAAQAQQQNLMARVEALEAAVSTLQGQVSSL